MQKFAKANQLSSSQHKMLQHLTLNKIKQHKDESQKMQSLLDMGLFDTEETLNDTVFPHINKLHTITQQLAPLQTKHKHRYKLFVKKY